jgi:hypothetical protein
VPVFEWEGLSLGDLMGASAVVHGGGDVATSRIAHQMFAEGLEPDGEFEARIARTRWLEQNHAELSFPCGVVPRPKPGPQEPVLNVLPIIKQTISAIIAVILPSDLVFLLEDDAPEVTELGRIPRAAVRSVDVVDLDERHVPEPMEETFELDRPALALLRWSDQSKDDEERFAFRSAWLAWTCARKLLAAKQG